MTERRASTPFYRRELISGVGASLLLTLLGCKSNESPRVLPGDATPAPAVPPPPQSKHVPPTAATNAPEATPDEAAPAEAAPAAVAQPSSQVIYLQPLGDGLAPTTFEQIAQALGLYFAARVVTLPKVSLPPMAYYPPRSRYRAEKILDHLETITPADAQVIVGLTGSDISTTKGNYEDWGILGLATISGRECVISEFRARKGATSTKHVLDRLMKTVVHEVGHTIGLEHCPNYGCIMEDGKGSVLTTDHERDICEDCRKKAGSRLLGPPASLPWSAPSDD